MAVTQEFKQAVLQNNNLKTKIMLKDSLLVDTSFNQFDEMLSISKHFIKLIKRCIYKQTVF